jgi:hypothetical protein
MRSQKVLPPDLVIEGRALKRRGRSREGVSSGVTGLNRFEIRFTVPALKREACTNEFRERSRWPVALTAAGSSRADRINMQQICNHVIGPFYEDGMGSKRGGGEVLRPPLLKFLSIV